MKPITSSSATGSFIPDSPSSERASRLRRVELRSTAKMAAESVAAIAAPTISPSSSEKPKISFAAKPASSAVASVPTVASDAAVPSTGRISDQPEVIPPSKRINTSAIVPSVRARSAFEKSIPPTPSEPASIPSPRNSSNPGIRTRSASRAPAIPAASSTPAIRISSASWWPIEGPYKPGARRPPGRPQTCSSSAARRASSSSGEPGSTSSPGRSTGRR